MKNSLFARHQQQNIKSKPNTNRIPLPLSEGKNIIKTRIQEYILSLETPIIINYPIYYLDLNREEWQLKQPEE